MIQAFLLSATLLATPVQEPKSSSKIVGASLFKNGFAVVLRETTLTNGEALIENIPQASLGTLWLSSSPGVVISEAVTTTQITKSERDANSLDEVLLANVGKAVLLDLITNTTIEGKLLGASGQIIIIESAGKRHAIQKAQVRSVASPTGELVYKLPSSSEKRIIRIKTTGAKDGKIYTFALERGITWAPGYSLDISDPKKLSLLGKATILNDLGDIEGLEARLITGFPNLPYRDVPDPFTAGTAIQAYQDQMMGLGAGGFGGGQGPGGAMSQNMLRSDARGNFDQSFDISSLPAMEGEDLFFYRRPNVTLKKGERGYYVLFKIETDYEHIYTWDVADSVQNDSQYRGTIEGPGDVWHSLKFKNTSDMPWTTAPAITMKNGEILGQDMLTYTARGTNALVKITKALNIRADHSEEEVARERAAYRVANTGAVYDLVTLKGTLEIKNRKNEAVKLSIIRWVTGEVVSAEGSPKITKAVKGLRQVNSSAKIEWEVPIAAGKEAKLSFAYKVYIAN